MLVVIGWLVAGCWSAVAWQTMGTLHIWWPAGTHGPGMYSF